MYILGSLGQVCLKYSYSYLSGSCYIYRDGGVCPFRAKIHCCLVKCDNSLAVHRNTIPPPSLHECLYGEDAHEHSTELMQYNQAQLVPVQFSLKLSRLRAKASGWYINFYSAGLTCSCSTVMALLCIPISKLVSLAWLDPSPYICARTVQ